MQNLAHIVLIYTDTDGITYEQPLSDVQHVGTLVHPETGEDLTMTSWRFINGHDPVIV